VSLNFAPDMQSANPAGARKKLEHAAVSPALLVQNFECSSDFWMNLSFAGVRAWRKFVIAVL
jgi:hypothetical protein